jgi:phosphoglycolate phosphatase
MDSPNLPYSAVLLDLDGTIVDSASGITDSLAHTYEQLGLPVPSPARMLEWVGPPIMDSFRDLAGLDPEESQRALELYRDHYLGSGNAFAPAYSAIVDVLRAISEAGVPLSLATSKPEGTARAMLDRLGIVELFTEITGSSDDETRSRKADVVAEALRRLAARGTDISRAVMVGDRRHDIEGAAEHNVPTIFVTWGYGAPEESAGAVAVVDTPAELLAALGLAEVSRRRFAAPQPAVDA